ncbi:MAG: hypothetical protein AAF318_16160 [Pseudomonadota bacterium]
MTTTTFRPLAADTAPKSKTSLGAMIAAAQRLALAADAARAADPRDIAILTGKSSKTPTR